MVSSDQMRGVWLLLLLTGWCSAQQGEYVLAGSVVNARTGEPVKRALVTATRQATPEESTNGAAMQPVSASALTDVSGAFRFTGLAAGTYSLWASKPHFDAAQAGAPIDLKKSSREDVRVELSPFGAIEGRIDDQRDEPVSGVSLLVMHADIADGRRRTQLERFVSTDDRGIYRVWDVPPGRYVIEAVGSGATFTYLDEAGPSNGGFLSFVPAYFGGPTTDSATPVVIEPGTEARANIGVLLQPAYKVRGTLTNLGTGEVTFALFSGDEQYGTGRVNFSRASGAFEMLEVVNGSYALLAMQNHEVFAELPIVVHGGDVNGLRMALAGPAEIPVIVRILDQPAVKAIPEGQQQLEPQNLGFCYPALRPSSGGYPIIPGPGDGAIQAPPGRYRFDVSCGNAYVISATLGTTDLLANPGFTVAPGLAQAPIEIVARHGGGIISGAIKLGQVPTGKTMFVLAVPRFSARAPESTQASDDGQFSFESLAPGDYTLYGFSTDQLEYRSPEFLRGLTGGESVHVEDGATAAVTITRLAQ